MVVGEFDEMLVTGGENGALVAASAWRTYVGGERANTLLQMVMEYAVQRLEMGDVVLIYLPEEGGEVEATVVRPVDRTETTIRALLRVHGREDFLKEWSLGEMVTVLRGP